MLSAITKPLYAIFGTANERLIKAYRKRVDLINALEPEFDQLTDAQLKERAAEYKARVKKGETVNALMPHIMALARQVMDRAVGIRNVFNPEFNFDPSQLPADVRADYDRVVAEMATLSPIEELGCADLVPVWQQVNVPNSIYSAVRKLYPISRPPFRARPFDVQLIGGMVLGEGRIAEMRTGEGKTIVAPLACFVACLEGLQCYVVTVNDYLVQRDRDWVFPFYYHTGFQVGAIHPYHMQQQEGKAQAYKCNVVYGTNAEFGFDYLRDNMKTSVDEQVQKHRDFCIIDEVDSILIDEARTPLIISGPAHEDAPRYALADDVARHLVARQRNWDLANEKVQAAIMRIKGYEGDIRNSRDKEKANQMRGEMKALQEKVPQLEDDRDKHTRYYEVEIERKSSHLTHEGIAEAQKRAAIGSFYVGNNMDFPHLLENSLRAHAVYTRDKDYVVHEGEVIIVDEFTGRPMIGRQWSDGLHQAVEAKEAVKIKQETQTLATVTIQNYFKLFKRLAGMTGTAATEATEFNDIYRLEVVAIPTNKPVIRTDKPDLVFVSQKDKWSAILDEIKRFYDIGRPVLVGTTNVENSEMLSKLLKQKFDIKHQVLNAKQTFKENEKEAHLIDGAGKLAAVMIATNMAGRGTDIKLQPIAREELLRHWQLRDIAPYEVDASMPDETIVNLVYRHLAGKHLGLRGKEIEPLSDADVQLKLLQKWVEVEAWVEPAKAAKMTAEQCRAMLDDTFGFMFHRITVYKHVEEMGGLHIVGTERHESRRIDNQLRGRAGRQGDRGSSRFFVALEDELMARFAGPKVLAILSQLGMKEGDAIESQMVTNRIEAAQKKVEERNYQIRKQLLDYDEVMEHQRNFFYGLRQDVLEGKNIDTVIFDYIEDAVADAVNLYMDRDYVPTQIAEWCRTNLDISIEAYKLREGDLRELQTIVRRTAREDTRATIDITIGEYMSNDVLPEEWDIGNLVEWAKTKFNVELRPSQIRQMSIPEVTKLLTEKALELVEAKDLEGLGKFMDKQYGLKALAEWAQNQFDIKLELQDLANSDNNGAAKIILNEARKVYRIREVVYPIDFVLDITFQSAQNNSAWAAQNLTTWANRRFEMGWTPETVITMSGAELREKMIAAAEPWIHGNKADGVVAKAMAENKTPEDFVKWTAERLGLPATVEEFENVATREKVVRDKVRKMLRSEINMLEQFVLQQILDVAWKDHLYGMQQLKDSVSLRGYAEKDPRIEYKREGANLFAAMQRHVRDRVTELIFRAQLRGQVESRSVYNVQNAVHPDPAAVAAEQAKLEQQAEGGEEETEEQLNRRARRAPGKEEDEGGDDDQRPKFKERKKR